MDNSSENYTPDQSLNDLDSGQDNKYSNNNNSRKNLRVQQIYTRGAGPLRKSAEPELDSKMTSTSDTTNVAETTEDNANESKRSARKPDSPLYTVKGATDREGNGYQDNREHSRHRGGRDNFSNNSQRRNQFTNNNRNKHRRDFVEQAKKSDDNSNPIIAPADTSTTAPPVINHRSEAILNQSTKSYVRNDANPTPAAVVETENTADVAPVTSSVKTNEPPRDMNRNNNNNNNYKNNKNSQYQNRRNNNNYNDHYDRGRQQNNRRGRDDRHYYEDYGGRDRHNYQGGGGGGRGGDGGGGCSDYTLYPS
uniref:Uncharacterized protein n=2 Tax=Cacopsylla melanoneura TaxID=428564 RepID=A0A8D8TQ63_9HEMI